MKKDQSAEFLFYVKADLKKFGSGYIALVGDRVVASGRNAKAVWQKARKVSPHKTPTLAKLPRQAAMILFVRWKKK